MKEIEFDQMEHITAGGQGRTCMIIGGVAVITFIGGFFFPPIWNATAGSVVGAAVYGCF